MRFGVEQRLEVDRGAVCVWRHWLHVSKFSFIYG